MVARTMLHSAHTAPPVVRRFAPVTCPLIISSSCRPPLFSGGMLVILMDGCAEVAATTRHKHKQPHYAVEEPPDWPTRWTSVIDVHLAWNYQPDRMSFQSVASTTIVVDKKTSIA